MALRYEGWTVAIASTGSEALAAYRGSRPDIAILDVMLPDTDGFALLTELRQLDPHLPVLMLTARDSTQDRVSGLQLGADDYLVKPFSLEELVARLQAILRRTSAQPDRAAAERIVVGDLVIDVPGRQVQRAGEPVTLTPTEFELLALLARNAGAVLAKGLILDRVWNYDFSGNSNVVELYVGYLRRKLDPLGPPMIHTVRGVGYVMRVPGGSRP